MPRFKHGHAKPPSPTYSSWKGMTSRCLASGAYGPRGITVCERWRTFSNFLADMGERPAGCEMDRIDPAGNYEPDNCRWLSKTVNRRYRTTTKLTPAVRTQIKELHGKGMSHRKIAAAMGLPKSTVGEYLRGDHWI